MAADELATATVRCPNCYQAISEVVLQTCPMCRNLFCSECVTLGYGRSFCGTRCRDYFFFGDGDATVEDF